MKWAVVFSSVFALLFGYTGSAWATVAPIDTMSLDGGLITIDEFSDHYDVHNHTSNLYIFAFAVSNPVPSASTTFEHWLATTGFLKLGDSATAYPVNAYYQETADIDPLEDTHLPSVTSTILAQLIGPGQDVIGQFLFGSSPTSVAGLLAVDSNGDQVGFNSSATPLPAALPLFAGGLGIIGLLVRRRKQKQVS